MFFSIRANLMIGAVLFFMLSSAVCGSAAEIELLQKAFDVSRQSSFKSTLQRQTPAGEAYTVFYQLVDPGDHFTYRRMDFITPGAKKIDTPEAIGQSNRTNRSGSYLFTGEAVVKENSGKDFFGSIELKPGMSISTKDAMYGKIPCREFSVSIDGHPMIGGISYWAGKDNSFIYAWEVRDKQGKRLVYFELGDVDFKAKLSADLFEIPKDIPSYQSKGEAHTAQLLAYGTESRVRSDLTLTKKLNDALAVTEKTTFRAIRKTPSDNGTINVQIFYQLFHPQDGFLYQRRDFIKPGSDGNTPDAILQSERLNPSGFYVCVGNLAVKMKVARHWLPEKSVPVSRIVKASPVNYKNIPCIVYTVTYPADVTLPEAADKQWFPFMTKYIAGRDNSFVYAWQTFNRVGGPVEKWEFEDVDFDVKLAPDFFAPPQDAKIRKADNLKQAAEYFGQEKRKAAAGPGWISRQMSAAGSWFEANLGTILSWGGKITFVIALLTAMLAVVLKIRARRKCQR